jgi:DNA-binding NarL/FixJ family response regulator
MQEANAVNVTPTETSILRMIVGGMSDAEIAFALDASNPDVDIQIKEILLKIGARDRAAAASVALEKDLIRAEL